MLSDCGVCRTIGAQQRSPCTRGAKPTDPQIAHIAYTAGVIDIAAAKQASPKSKNKAVRRLRQGDGARP